MVILAAIENPDALQTLESFLSRHTSHQILTAGSVGDVMEIGTQEERIDLLLTGSAFSNADSEAVRDGLRQKFPDLRTGFICADGEAQPALGTSQDRLFAGAAAHYDMLEWVHELEREPAPAPPTSRLVEGGPESLEGQTLGDYKVLEKRRDFETTESYLAFQESMQRHVVLERLKPAFQNDRDSKRGFRALVRARAKVGHPSIATVYEAQETNHGEIYYTRELVQGAALSELERKAAKIPQESLLKLLRVAGEAMTYLDEQHFSRGRLGPQDIYLGDDGIPRVRNIVTHVEGETPETPDAPADLEVLAAYVASIGDFAHGRNAALQSVLKRMRGEGNAAVRSWQGLANAARIAQEKLAEEQARHAAESAARPALPQRRKRRSRMLPVLIGMAVALGGIGAVIWLYPRMIPAKPRNLDYLVRIPAGSFVFQNGEKKTLKEFWIDKYEVTIAAYADFLAAIAANPTKFDHKDQPKTKKDHKPQFWDEYHAAAVNGQEFSGHRITVNCPVMWVDGWDAHAYANWKGRRLPTDEEWEKAARGASGLEYPWGNSADPTRANSGSDYSESISEGGGKDGFGVWCDVDAKEGESGDASPYGVIGLSGNVAEWTQSWTQHPSLPEQKVPVYRGGSFMQKDAPLRDQRWTATDLNYTQASLGFRTVSDKAP